MSQIHHRRTMMSRPITRFRVALLMLFVFFGTGASTAFAACARDRSGDVFCGAGECLRDHDGVIWCSRFYEGAAALTRGGEVRCGKGECQRDSQGRIFCSSEPGGSVMKDSAGRIRCYGRCEPASLEACEHTAAGTSDRS